MSVLFLSVAAAVWFYVAVYYVFFRSSRCCSSAQLNGRTVIVTGSNTGIGKATALDLAQRGARVILACRNKEKAEAAAFDIRRTGNSQVVFMHLDLASLKSVRCFAETFLNSEPRLDVLVNNAGVMASGHTDDGFGMTFGVNHLGHFLLTNLLLDRLRQCGRSRVVTVTALLHHLGTVDFPLLDATKDLVSGQTTRDVFRAYCNSKLCNVLFTRELANRLEGSGVTCYSLHPGVVYTELCRNISWWQRLLLTPVARLFFLDPEAGSQTVLHCVLQQGIEHLSGRCFSNCTLLEVGAKGRDDALAKKLWEVSERLTGIS
ncbi:dehydrogenase/reductase SDR family member 13-like isoform X2 [Thalassophryne amazonica]|uniref:dehydrogenase/reductase SDR family member 13-like isoform X2 n=1 Tax=Thalassophryne amazonica TaxID=390379 RepID=UPI0014709F53|nr:dehydrogenase/reductase SDR family member 13-like isoform X2 [Thalassophryne amazonica]